MACRVTGLVGGDVGERGFVRLSQAQLCVDHGRWCDAGHDEGVVAPPRITELQLARRARGQPCDLVRALRSRSRRRRETRRTAGEQLDPFDAPAILSVGHRPCDARGSGHRHIDTGHGCRHRIEEEIDVPQFEHVRERQKVRAALAQTADLVASVGGGERLAITSMLANGAPSSTAVTVPLMLTPRLSCTAIAGPGTVMSASSSEM